jgi:hypothetical protein
LYFVFVRVIYPEKMPIRNAWLPREGKLPHEFLEMGEGCWVVASLPVSLLAAHMLEGKLHDSDLRM